MPYYEYYCNNCGVGTAAIHGMNEEFDKECEYCKAKDWRQTFFPPALKFTGVGFYETDYKRKSK